jgi:regulator of sigma E protease
MSLLSVGSFFIFLIILSLLVFVHELGHFLLARWFRVHIEEFGIGFPPRLVGVVRDVEGKLRVFFGLKAPSAAELGGPRTIYSLNAIPIGGFVRPVGEDNPSIPGGLAASSKTARISILAAGSTFNLIFAFLVFIFSFRLGWPDGRVLIAEVVPDSPAQRAGLQPGDVVLRANDTDVKVTQDLSRVTHSHLGQPVELLIERAGQSFAVTLIPRTQWPNNQGPMGIRMDREIVQYPWGQAIVRAAQEIRNQFEAIIHLPALIIQRQLPSEMARPCGPVCLNDLTRVAVTAAQETNHLFPLIQLIGVISIALAITNLLPLPALDGGRILFVLIEAVRGRRVDPAREGLVHLVGMAMLLALMLIITYQDIFNPIVPR